MEEKKSASFFSANLSVILSDTISTERGCAHAAQSTCVCVHVKKKTDVSFFACERGEEAEMKEETQCQNLQMQEG